MRDAERSAAREPLEIAHAVQSCAQGRSDRGLIHELAERVGLDLPQAETNLDAIRTAAGAIGGDADFSAVATQLRNDRKGATTQAAGGR